MDYQTPRFVTSQVAKACGIQPGTLRTYFSRKQFRILGAKDAQLADGEGLPNKFSLRDAIGFAAAVALIKVGADPKAAFEAGVVKFGHSSAGDRLPGMLFDLRDAGETLLVFDAEGEKAHVVADDGLLTITDIRQRYRVTTPVVLNMNDLEQRVFAALGLDPRDQ